MRKKRTKWHFTDLDKVEVEEDGRYFEVVGDLPGGIRVKSVSKKDVAEQFRDLVESASGSASGGKKTQTKLKGLA